MTKANKLEKQKYNEKSKNMTTDEKKVYDRLLEMQEQYESLVYELHTLIFPEEYDFMNDSSSEAQERRRGKNPMSDEYIKRINTKREKLGLLPLNENGLPADREKSMEYCKKLLSKEVEIF